MKLALVRAQETAARVVQRPAAGQATGLIAPAAGQLKGPATGQNGVRKPPQRPLRLPPHVEGRRAIPKEKAYPYQWVFQMSRELKKGDLLTREQEWMLFETYGPPEKRREIPESVSERIRAIVILANQRLVWKIAHAHKTNRRPFEDHCQEGNLGLLYAYGKFDYTKGYQFSTYATWWVRAYMASSPTNPMTLIRLPSGMMTKLNRITRFVNHVKEHEDREPSIEEIMEATGLSRKNVENLRAYRDAFSLETPVGEDQTVADFVEDVHAENPEQELARKETREWVGRALLNPVFSARESDILRRRWGLPHYHREQTLKEIGLVYGISRERVRQVEERAKGKLRRLARSREGQDIRMQPVEE